MSRGQKQPEAPARDQRSWPGVEGDVDAEWTQEGLVERRRHERRPVTTFVWYKILDREQLDAGVEGIARSFDISEGGLAMVLPRPLPVNERVFLEIGVGSLRLSAVGYIVRVHEQEGRHFVGIEFQLLPPNDRIQLQRYFRRGQP